MEAGRETVLMQTTFKVYRYDSEAGGKPTFQQYALELPEDATVLDGLFKIREELDGTLAFRASCNRGFCGECTLRINRGGRLACMTRVVTTRTKEGEVTVEPTRHVRVLKDLVYDVDRQLWQKIRAVEPWLQPAGARPEGEYVVSDAELRPIRNAMKCYYCGLCDEGCSVIPFDNTFLGPTALTKAYRFVADPRDGARAHRLRIVGEPRGMWDCVHCYEADEHCPRGIEPTARILDLREMAVGAGIKSGTTNPQVARHYDSFASSVRKSGWLDEGRLALETWGIGRALDLLPVAWRALRRGKLPIPYRHHKRPGAERIDKIFEKVERRTP
jgi:succinate dehydrogenase / fumarate reductase iron-sulfur subunit